jgi:tRNA-dihydrouridine synthase B
MSFSLSIGGIKIPNNVFLAPMVGITDLPFRGVCRNLGTGMVTGEMTGSSAALRSTRKSWLRGVHANERTPRSVQIVGWDPRTMADAARYNVDQGASIIDINMGCPAKKVCRKLAGSALLGDEFLVERILRAVVESVPVPVTLKMRTGTDPENRNGLAVARIAESCGVKMISVHGRTRACKFHGEPEYITVKEIKSAVTIPVIANGDLDTIEKARSVFLESGVDGVMIGRGAYGRPWFPGQVAEYLNTGRKIPSPDLSSQREIVLQHLEQIYSFYGNDQGVRIARKHIKWYVQNYPGNLEFREMANNEVIPEKQLEMVSSYYLRTQDYLKAA